MKMRNTKAIDTEAKKEGFEILVNLFCRKCKDLPADWKMVTLCPIYRIKDKWRILAITETFNYYQLLAFFHIS
jgi:hypothetical protein